MRPTIPAILVLVATQALGQNPGLTWPIPTSDGTWYYVNGTFGELHSGYNFHRAIDIDHAAPNQSALAVREGRVFTSLGGSGDEQYVVIEHESQQGSGIYDRRTRYMHVNGPTTVTGQSIAAGTPLAKINNSSPTNGNHLHFEMWQLTNGVWYRVNPMSNDQGWALGYPQGHPDAAAPEVNQVFLTGVAQQNGAASGYVILQSPNGALADFDGNTAARIHLRDRPGQSSCGIATYSTATDRLAVFGNIGPIIHCRDVAVTASAASHGEGLTIHSATYSVDNTLKFDITFSRLPSTSPGPPCDDVYHRHYNDVTNQNAETEVKYGNNDYLRLFNDGTHGYQLCHHTIDGVQSNGIWATKARSGAPVNFQTTPTDMARANAEAMYADGEHALRFQATDDAGLPDVANVQVIVDNFRPCVKQVQVFSGANKIYDEQWNWNAGLAQLEFSNNNVGGAADGQDDISVQMVFSEPMNDVSVAVDPSTGWVSGLLTHNGDKTEWTQKWPASCALVAGTGSYTLVVDGHDLASNQVQGYTTHATVPAGNIPHRTSATQWSGPGPQADRAHALKVDLTPPLKAQFSAAPKSGSAPLTVHFTDESQGGPTSWAWEIEPMSGVAYTTGSPSAPNPIVCFSQSGIYQVCLSVSDGQQSNETQSPCIITVSGGSGSQAADFTVSSTTVPKGGSATFTDLTSPSLVTRYWSFEGGSPGTSSEQSPIVQYNTLGDFDVTLSGTDVNGGTRTLTKQDYLHVCPTNTGFVLSGSACPTYTTGFVTYDLNALFGEPPYHYKIEFGDGTSEEPDVTQWYHWSATHYYVPGTYSASANATDGTNAQASFAFPPVHVTEQNLIEVKAAYATVCDHVRDGTAVEFVDQSSPKDQLNQWQWWFEFPKDNASGPDYYLRYETYRPSVSHTYSGFGVRTVHLIIWATGSNVGTDDLWGGIGVIVPSWVAPTIYGLPCGMHPGAIRNDFWSPPHWFGGSFLLGYPMALTIAPGQSIVYSASDKIYLKPGFKAQAGCHFRATVSDPCLRSP